jgi:uncharacterized membrane protein YphA (DoxX/SURF4 family)
VPDLVLAVRLLLAALFLLAGAGKLADPGSTRGAAAELGVPRRLVPAIAPTLPLIELGLAAALIDGATARVAAIGAGVLLAAFSGALGVALARGRRPACRCFGPLTRTAAGPGELARDVAMLAFAVIAAVLGPGAPPPGGGLAGGLLAVGAAGCVAAPFAVAARGDLADLRGRHQELAARVRALEVGPAEAPAVSELDDELPSGGPAAGLSAPPLLLADGADGVRLVVPRAASRDLLLLFLEPDCSYCRALLPDISTWQRAGSARLSFWVIYGEDPQAAAHVAREFGIEHVYARAGQGSAELYQIPGTPSGVLLDSDGTVKVSLAAGSEAIRELVDGLTIRG